VPQSGREPVDEAFRFPLFAFAQVRKMMSRGRAASQDACFLTIRR